MQCFWCKKVLEFDSCEIDLVVPGATSKIVLKSMVKEYDLDADFSLNGAGNLVPACELCVNARAKAAFKPTQVLPSWVKIMRINSPLVEANVRQIEGEPSRVALLRQLVEKLERGEITPEVLKEVVEPFMDAVEASRIAAEFRLSDSVRLSFNKEGWRMQPLSEIRYEKLVDGIVESGEWKKRSAVERVNEGPEFGEGRKRRPVV